MSASPELTVITLVNPVCILLYLFNRQLSAEKVHTALIFPAVWEHDPIRAELCIQSTS